jgi:hypothetical protein
MLVFSMNNLYLKVSQAYEQELIVGSMLLLLLMILNHGHTQHKELTRLPHNLCGSDQGYFWVDLDA